MYKLLVGPLLMGAGYAAGSVYGADAEQPVHKSPAVAYASVDEALGNIRQSGTTSFEGGRPVPYELRIERVPNEELTVTLSFNGVEGARAELDFLPKGDGKDTLLVAKIHGDHSVLRTALAGTDKARLAYAPDWMLNLAVKPLLQQLATQIEQGESSAGLMQASGLQQDEAQWEASLNAAERQEVSEAQQYAATQPAVDPNAGSQQQMNDGPQGQ